MTYFVPIGVIKDKTTKMYCKYFNGKLWPYHLSCFTNSFLYDSACKSWLFEKLIFELEASYSFEITWILIRQVRQKIGRVISKIYCLVSWSPICTPLILLSALMKMASTSTAVIYKYECGNPWLTSCIRVKKSDSRPFILVLDWMLVYVTSIMWANLPP